MIRIPDVQPQRSGGRRLDFMTQSRTNDFEAVEPNVALPAELSDEEIVAKVLAGDRAKFELILRRYNQRLYRVVLGILDREADVEDAIQDAYLHAFANLHQFRGEASFSTWLTRIAVHGALRRRKSKYEMISMDSIDDDQRLMGNDPNEHSPYRELERTEMRSLLTEMIDALPTSLRAVVMLRDVEGMSTREAAECLEMSEGNVRVRLHRAREVLREGLDRRLGKEATTLYTFGEARCDRVTARVMEVVLSGEAITCD